MIRGLEKSRFETALLARQGDSCGRTKFKSVLGPGLIFGQFFNVRTRLSLPDKLGLICSTLGPRQSRCPVVSGLGRLWYRSGSSYVARIIAEADWLENIQGSTEDIWKTTDSALFGKLPLKTFLLLSGLREEMMW